MSEKKPMTRKELRRRKRRRQLIIKTVLVCILALVLVVAIWIVSGGITRMKEKQAAAKETTASAETDSESGASGSSSSGTAAAEGETDPATATDERAALIAQATALAVQYDYEGAIALLNTIPGADTDAEIISLIADYETAKTTLVPTSPENITHIFFHSLVVDPARGFSLTGDSGWDSSTVGFCEWMTTVDEFNAILQQMYERGYVLISIYDMVDETTDENGVVHITPKDVYLPQGKIPFVLSLDDLSYYHSYNGRGTASRMIIGDDGTPTCEYIAADGTQLVGSYDCVPLLDDFLEQHPDFSYKGAKGTIALTGYDGILGYRTDYVYRDRVDLSEDQEAWLAANPTFDWNAECEAAKAVAECIKADGWTFASHTWGHIRIGDADMQWIQEDTEKWLNYVEPLIGDTDIIIFAHGQDLAAWNEDYASTEKFQYLKSCGFNIYCNVDSSQYFVQTGDLYLRMGRRNLDGYRLWMAVYGGDDRVSDLIDASTVFDPQRPTDASLYNL